MKIHYIQHVPFENLGNIENWAKEQKHSLSATKVYENANFPDLNSFDLLIILGGPMNILEEEKYSWLKQEKEFIKRAIDAKKTVLGICLGAQLIANILGANVYRNEHKEIGWFPVIFSKKGKNNILFDNIADEIEVFHWHGDTFDLPIGAEILASSKVCKNQAFIYQSRVIGLQFHLESSPQSIENLIKNCSDEIVNEQYIQTSTEMMNVGKAEKLESYLYNFLNNLETIT